MKNLLLVLIILMSLSACEIQTNTSQSSSSNDMEIEEHGLKCDDVYLEIREKKVDRTSFNYGEEVFFSFNDVTGFEKKDGSVYPGLSIEITNTNDKTIVLEDDDLFPKSKGFSESVILLYSNVTMALPYKDNEEYNVKIKIWDKVGDGSLTFEMPFEIIENEELVVDANDVTYNALYLWNGDKNIYVANDNVNRRDELLLIYEGVNGFKEINGLVYPGLSLSLIDADGEEIIEKDNLFSEYTENGMSLEQFNTQLYINIEFYVDSYANPLELKAVLFDKNSECELILNTEIEVH